MLKQKINYPQKIQHIYTDVVESSAAVLEEFYNNHIIIVNDCGFLIDANNCKWSIKISLEKV